MFKLIINKGYIKHLEKIAETQPRRMTTQKLARLAFLKGLRLLQRAAGTDGTSDQTLARPDIEAYIREHWQQKTDVAIGITMGCRTQTIRAIRMSLGFKKNVGRRVNMSHAAQPTPEQTEQDNVLRTHWEHKDDWEIGKMMIPPVSGNAVRRRRAELGLRKTPRSKHPPSVKDALDPSEFERMITEEGYTMTEYRRLKGIACSRERIRQIAAELGIKHSPEDRTAMWGVKRRARKVGNPNLLDPAWVEARITSAVSIASAAATIGIRELDLFFLMQAFGITHPASRKHGVETVELLCATCGITFTRLKRYVNRKERNANGEPLNFYCSESCVGKRKRKQDGPSELRL